MADILLSVGMQTGSAETKEFINQLKSVVNGLNSAEDIKAKVGMQIDTTGIQEFRRQLSQLAEVSSSSFAKEIIAGMQGIGAALRYNMEQLNDMSKMLDTISKKDFTTALDFSGLFKGSNDSDISAYKHKVTTYINTVKEAYDELARVTSNVRGGKSIASSAGVNVTKFFDQFNELASNIGGLRSGVNLKSNNSIGKLQGLAQSAQELITPLIPLFNELKAAGATDFDISKILTIPEAPVTNADAARQSLIGLADAFKQFQQTMSQTQQVPQQIISDESIRKTSKQTQTIEEQEQAMWDAFNAEKEIAAERAKIVKNSEIDKGYQERASQIAAEEAARKAADQKAIEAWYKAEDEREAREAAAAEKRAAREEKEAAKRLATAEKVRATEEAAAQKQAEREEKAAEKRAAEAEKASERAIKATQQEKNAREDMLRTAESQINKIESMMRKTTYGSSDYRALDEMRSKYRAFADDLNKIDTSKAKSNLKELGTEFTRLSGQINRSQGGIQLFGGGLSMLYSRINYYLSLSNMIMQGVRAVKQMAQTTTELDTSLTQLQVVTGSSGKSIREYGLAAAQTAQEIGGSTKELIDSTTTFARLGYTLEESSTLSKYTNMLKNVGDIDTTVATDAITAILKAYDIDATQIESVMDKMVEVGNNFPISVSEIAEGMNNAGSALHAAGNSFEQSVALLTAANTTVQNISKSSTGLRTITARIRGTKLELDDLGESIETAKYQEALDILTKYKVQLTQNGQFRSTYDILKDIASVWKDLSNMEQANIAEQLAGNRQQNVFYSIIEQFSEAEKAMTAMEDSTGALTSAYANFADSIQGKLNTFKATFDELAQSFTKSEFLKEIIDFGTTLLNIANAAVKITDSLGGLKTILYAIGGIIATMKIDSFVKSLSGLPALLMSKLPAAFKSVFDMARLDGASSFRALGTAARAGFSEIISAASTAQIAVSGLFAALAIGSIVTGFIKRNRQEARQQQEDTYQTAAANAEEAKSVYDLYEAYEVAKQSYDDSAESKAALESASKALADALNIESWAAEDAAKSFRNLSKAQLENGKTNAKLAVDESEKLLTGKFSGILEDKNTKFIRTWAGYNGINLSTGSQTEKAKKLIDVYDQLVQKRKEWLNSGDTESVAYKNVDSAIRYLEDDVNRLREAYKSLGDIEEEYDNIVNDTVASAKNAEDELANRQRKIDNIVEAFSINKESVPSQGFHKDFLEQLDTYQLDRYTDAVMRGATSFAEASQIMRNVDLVAAYNRLNSNQYSDAFANVLRDIGDAAEEAGLDVDDFIMKFGDFNDATARNIRDLSSLEDELKNATEALKQYNDAISGENGEIASQYGDAYKKFLDDWNAGKTGTKAVRAAIELFLPDDVLKKLNYDMEAAGKLLASDLYQSIFNNPNSSDYGLNFFNFLNNNIKDLGAAGIEIKKVGDDFTFAYESSAKLAYALGMSEDAVNALLDALDAYGVQAMMSREDTAKLAEELNLTQQNAKTLPTELQRVANELAASGNTSIQVKQKMISLREGGFLNFDDEGIDDIISNAAEHFKIPEPDPITPEVDISSGLGNVKTLQGAINGLTGKTVKIGVVVAGPGSRSAAYTNAINSIKDTISTAEATGTKNAPGGPTLVNELGPEIISENGTAYIAGGGMPTVVDLDPGAIVLNADDTKKALRGTKHSIFKSKPIRAAYRGIGIGRPVTPDKYVVSLDEFGQLYDNGMVRKPTAAEIKDLILKKLKDKDKNKPTPKKDDEKEKQKFDWITIAIDRIQRAVSKLQKVASNTFKQLGTRLSASKKAVQEIAREIDIMQAGYDRYLKEAESVGLDSGLAKLVREGTIDINEYDDDTRKLIQDYQKWYEKAIDCRDAIDDLHQSIAQLYLDNFNNAQKDFENKLSSIEHAANMIDQNIAMADARGYLESAKFYDALSGNTVSRINTLKSELSGLKKMFNDAMASGEIEAGSEAWYQMSESIAKVEEELASANVQLEEYKNKIREINWSYFDYAQSRIDQITDEASFLIELMSNKELFNSNGGFSDYGTATLGMHVVGYDTAMAKADEYAEELKRIERELANDPYDTALIERREELIGLQQKSILNAESEKNAVRDLVEEGIKKELDALRDLIDAYNDSLDSAKDLYEYQKKVAKQTEDIASLEKQLAAYQNDTSQENRARVQKLQQQLREARTTLQETERDKSISDQKKLLDDLYNDYEEHLNHRLDNIDALMEEMISVASVSRDEITQTIEEASGRVGYTITDGMRTVLGESFSSYNEMFDHVTGIHTQLSQIRDLIASIAAASGATKAYAKGGLIDYTGIAAVHGSPGNPEMVLSAADTARFLEAAALMRSAPKLSDLASSGVFTGSTAFSGTVINGLTISIPIDHVQDYNDMISQMQRDPKFDRLINAITLDRVAGKSQMGKYGVRF